MREEENSFERSSNSSSGYGSHSDTSMDEDLQQNESIVGKLPGIGAGLGCGGGLESIIE